jgi:ribosomal-protein-alanine N-acetyltransferase
MKIHVRKARSADSTQVKLLFDNARRAYAGFGQEDLPTLLEEEPFLVAETGPLLWGAVGCSTHRTPWAEIIALALINGWRTDNAAREMLPPLLELLRERGVKHVMAICDQRGASRENPRWMERLLGQGGFERREEICTYVAPAGHVPRPMSDVQIRPATVGDLGLLLRLDSEAFPPMWAFDRKEMLMLLLLSGGQAMLAYLDDEPVGYAIVSVHQSIGEIIRLGVSPGHRGQGVGGTLMSAAMEFCEANGAFSVVLNTQSYNRPAQKLYESFGFQRYGDLVPVMVLDL